MMDTSEDVNVHTRQWALQAESEYRFELDPNTTLAIKVCPPPWAGFLAIVAPIYALT